MALLELDAAGTEALLATYPQVTVAVYASPRQTVIAGPPEKIDALIAVVEQMGRLARRIDVDVASHHPIIEPILPELRAAVADLATAEPAIPVISTTYDLTGSAPLFDADHWTANLRNPVRFSQAIAAAGQTTPPSSRSARTRCSPTPSKTSWAGTHHHSIGTLQREVDETLTFHTTSTPVTPPRCPSDAAPSRTTPTHPDHPLAPHPPLVSVP
jgi:acyl transferase domain-containing protein